eukprot:12933021-Prorocentrum_lima.AAC.1
MGGGRRRGCITALPMPARRCREVPLLEARWDNQRPSAARPGGAAKGGPGWAAVLGPGAARLRCWHE